MWFELELNHIHLEASLDATSNSAFTKPKTLIKQWRM